MNFQSLGLTAVSVTPSQMLDTGILDGLFSLFKEKFLFPKISKISKSKNHGKLGSSKIIYTAFFNM